MNHANVTYNHERSQSVINFRTALDRAVIGVTVLLSTSVTHTVTSGKLILLTKL